MAGSNRDMREDQRIKFRGAASASPGKEKKPPKLAQVRSGIRR